MRNSGPVIGTCASAAAKFLPPVGDDRVGDHPCFRAAVTDPVSIFDAPPGYLLTEGLAGALSTAGPGPLWLRLDTGDRDPAVLLTSVVGALEARGLGGATTDLMRARPGPVFGWLPLFDRLAGELVDGIRASGALVVEHLQHAAGTGLAMFATRVLPALRTTGQPVVLLSHRALDGDPLPVWAVRRSVPDVRLAGRAAACLAGDAATRGDPGVLDRCGGRAAALVAVRAAWAMFGPAADTVLAGATSVEDLLVRTAGLLLMTVPDDGRRRLGLATRLEYVDDTPADEGPWWQQLAADGRCAGTPVRLRTVWHGPLRRALEPDALPDADDLGRAADDLLLNGRVHEAIELFLTVSDDERAARAIVAHTDRLMDLGQWQTLEGWLGRLNREVLDDHPDLLRARGEIAAARGDAPHAQTWFDLATARLVACGDAAGACSTLLAASTVAANSEDLVTARARAAGARSLADAADTADAADRSRCRLWTGWQLAAVQLLGGDDAALLAFSQMPGKDRAGADHDPIGATARLSQQILDLRRDRERHRQVMAVLDRRERVAMAGLVRAVTTPTDPAGLTGSGWSGTPVPVRLRAIRPPARPIGNGRPTRELPAHEPPVAPDRNPPAAGPSLIVQLLGPMLVAVGDTPVEDDLGSRARSLLAYLVTHRAPWPATEVLVEALWSGASPGRGRNSLHVAMHGLRRAIRTATAAPVVVHAGAGYRLHPTVTLWSDADEFDHLARSGARHEQSGNHDAAITDFEHALGLYRGEFLADEPYEEWPAPVRERLRLLHIDVLDRLSGLQFAAGRYPRCADLCRRLIGADPCREDAHRRLMRCHCRQGRPHLALLQFRTCVRVLATDLRVHPGPETVELYHRIRRHEPV